MWHKPCRTFHPWCLCIKTRCLSTWWCSLMLHRTVVERDAAMSLISCMYRAVSQIPQCTRQISHNVPFCDRNVQTWTLLSQIDASLRIVGFAQQWLSDYSDVTWVSCISNHRQLDILFNSLFRLLTRKTQSSALLARCEGIHRWPLVSPHKGPVMRKTFLFHDVTMG